MILRRPSSSLRSRLGGAVVLTLAVVLLPWAPSLAQQPKDQPAAARELRQRQIEVLRQLLKTLEQQQLAEMRVLGEVDPVNRDERVQVVVGVDKGLSLPRITEKKKVQIISDGSGRDELPAAAGADSKKKPDRLPVPEEKLPASGKQKSLAGNALAGDTDRVGTAVGTETIKKQARAEAAGALLSSADDAQAREARKLREEIEHARAQIQMAAARLERLQAALDRLSKVNPATGAAPLGQGQLEVIRLRSASAADVARVLDEAFNGPQRPGTPRTERVRIVAEPITNVLLIAATPADLQSIRKLLESALDADNVRK